MKIQYLRLACLVGMLLGGPNSVLSFDEPSSQEQKELNRFLGTWNTTYTISKSEWSPKEVSGSASMSVIIVTSGGR